MKLLTKRKYIIHKIGDMGRRTIIVPIELGGDLDVELEDLIIDDDQLSFDEKQERVFSLMENVDEEPIDNIDSWYE